MSQSDDSPEFGITEEDRKKMRFLSENDARSTNKGAELNPTAVHEETENTGREDNGRSKETRRRNTADWVLSPPEFERLLIGALRIDDEQDALETWCAFVITGRLGLRANELVHLNKSWYDVREKAIQIPKHDPCTSGSDGAPCGMCKQAARQRQDHGDDRDFEEIVAEYWQPKTGAAVRTIPVGWSARCEEAVMLLLQMNDGYSYTYSTMKRRLDQAIDNAPMLEDGCTTLHGLRGTAATYHAANGVDREPLKQMMGWTSERSPQKYLRINGNMTKRALSKVYR